MSAPATQRQVLPRVQARPALTVVAVTIAVAAAIVQFTVPQAIPLLQRDGPALREGQWWRLVSPVAVQTLGIHQVTANLLSLAVIGAVAEHLMGRRWWVAAAVTGTASGQAAAYRWGEPGGGDSIAVCGLAGCVVAWLLFSRGRLPPWADRPTALYLAAVTGWDLRGPIGSAALCAIACGGWLLWPRPGVIDRLALLSCLACTAALCTCRDLHGVSLAAGLLTGALAAASARARPRAQA